MHKHESPIIVHRSGAGEGCGLGTSVLFDWCDGHQSTIEDAVRRTVSARVGVRSRILELIKDFDVDPGSADEAFTFAATLSWMRSGHGARVANSPGYGKEAVERLKRHLVGLAIKCANADCQDSR